MKKFVTLISLVAAAVAVTSCASADKMAKMAEQVVVTCNPSPLTVQGGKVTAQISVSYPEKYFCPKAILEVTPVMVYATGETAGEVLKYQGEKVTDNYRVVPSAGGTVTETVVFDYDPAMATSVLELRAQATTNNGAKWVTLPTKKVADGCIATETLICKCGHFCLKDSGYQEIIQMNPEGQVMYQINSAVVRNSELKGQSVADFQEALKEALANERKELKGIEVVAYASPDGGEDLNNRLSENRSKSADKAFKKVAKNTNTKGVPTEVKSIGEDWEGFQELVGNSNIEDKDLILRVLSMYKDSNVREREIRNMSSIYQDLAKDVLPQLRRARFIADVEFTNYSEAELLDLVQKNSDILDEPALLKAAELCKDKADKVALYKKAIDKYNSASAKYDLAVLALKDKDLNAAEAQLKKCDLKDADVVNLAGVCALRNGDLASAKSCFEAAKTADAQKNLGVCAALSGDYATAVEKLGDKGPDAAVAKLLNGNTTGAMTALDGCTCPKADYIRAICLNRQGKVTEAKAALKKATDKDEKLAERAKTDIEFANL